MSPIRQMPTSDVNAIAKCQVLNAMR